MPRKSNLETASVTFQLPSPPQNSTCACLIRALFKHLLYARGHIPYLYDHLLQQLSDEQQQRLEEHRQETRKSRARKRKLKKSDKLKLQLLHKTEALLDSLDSQKFSNFHPTRIFILFGASTAQPKEAYEILLPAASTDIEDATSPIKDDYACRSLLRQLIINAPELPEGAAPQRPGKVFLLLENTSEQGAPPGFLLKKNFTLKMRKGIHVKFLLGAAALQSNSREGLPASLNQPTTLDQPSNDDSAQKPTWLQSKFVLRGLRTKCDFV